METQQGIGNKGISTFLSFGAKNVQPDILEKMLVGRQSTVNLLEKYAREIANNGINHQVFIVGPRGSGKTHMLRVLYYRIAALVQKKDIVVAYFAEEEYGISGYLDFLIRIINAFMRWYDADKPALEARLNVLRESSERQQEYIAETIISDYIADKPLLILSENFDSILEALGKDGQSKLRAWLYRHNRISIMATAQAMSPDLGREDRPFYGFFSNIFLKKLTYEESLELLRNLAEIEQNPTMIEHLAGKGQAQVRAIHELIKGNHRLLVTFYEFLKANSLADLSAIFMKTMNDLKPYYETFIRFLPAQQQKILHYLALAKIPQKGTDIGKNCFIATTSLTKQLSELQRQNLIDALSDPTDKRNKLYDVSEPLLRIAIEIGEQREGITALFIDFLALYYSHEEIQSQKARFEDLYQREVEPLKKQKLYWEVEARDQALRLQTEIASSNEAKSAKLQEQINLGFFHAQKGNYIEAITAYKQACKIDSDSEIVWTNLGVVYTDIGDWNAAINAYKKAIKLQPNFEWAWSFLGSVYDLQGNYKKAIEAYEKTVQIKPDWGIAWNSLGKAYTNQNNYSQAIQSFRQAILIDSEDVTAWHNIGVTYYYQNDYAQAIISLQKVIQIKSDFEGAWGSLGAVYFKQKDYHKAAESFQQAIQVNPNDHWSWNFLGMSYIQEHTTEQAITAFQQVINIRQDDYWGWYGLGIAYGQKGDFNQASKAFQKAIELGLDKEMAIKRLEMAVIEYLKLQTASEPELNDLETWLQERSGFEIISSYVTTYRRVVFDKDEKALYELPKEQRLFFEREILKRE